jgi:membrane-bound metal-dependent hydrolase YbcI (DUF457 family)
MLGRDHALLGAVTFLAAAPSVAVATHQSMPPAELVVGAMVCAGFALLPDIDEPHSTVSRKLGPISMVVSAITNKVAGGHRHATHSLLFVGLVGFGAWYAVKHSPWAAAIIVACAMLLAARMVFPLDLGKSFLIVVALSGGAAYWAMRSHDVGYWLPAAAAAGVLLHLIGDMLTVEGVPLFWPLPPRLAVPVVGHTSSIRETILGSLLSLALLFLLLVSVLLPFVRQAPSLSSNLHLPSVNTSNLHAPSLPPGIGMGERPELEGHA